MCDKGNRLKPLKTRIRTRTRTLSLLKNDVVQQQHRPIKESPGPARRSRTKTRKPKYLSLRLQLSKQTETPVRTPSSEITEMTSSRDQQQQQQLNLFPLHPENLVDDDDRHAADDNNVALLFNSDGGASLNGLLPTAAATTMSSEEDSERRRFDREYNYLSEEEDHQYYDRTNGRNISSMNSLVRTAMRNRERDMSEEKWVSYSEVVEEVTSSSCSTEILGENKKKNLALKLDYQQILNAWSDKGSLFIQGDSPQTVPDLHDNATHVRYNYITYSFIRIIKLFT